MYQQKGQASCRGEWAKINHTTGKKWLFYPYMKHTYYAKNVAT